MANEQLVIHHPKKILPFKVRHALAGLDFDEASENLLKYLSLFCSKIPTEAIYFLHAIPRQNLFNIFVDEDLASADHVKGIDRELVNQLKSIVSNNFSPTGKIKVKTEIVQGDPLQELLETADKIESDLVVIGQNTSQNRHGILGKNFARQIWGNALIVPDKSKMSLRRILVPVDFSTNSAEALRAAISISKNLEKKAAVSVLHNYQLPPNFSAYRYNHERVMEMLREDRESTLKAFINDHVAEEDRSLVKPFLLGGLRTSVGKSIQSFAEKRRYDLIVMGAKGHSKVALLLLGSVTEKVISLTKRTPVLIVR